MTIDRAPLRAAALLAALLAGCWSTHEWPEPMAGYRPALEELVPREGGPLEVTVFRHSDPVQVRRASSTGAFPLRFFAKRERVKSGGMMLVGPGGRGEVIWAEAGTNAVLFDEGALLVGEPGRGEPTMTLLSVSRGRFRLAPADRLRLLGGAELTTTASVLTGPFVVEKVEPDVLRVRNQTKQPARIAYLDEVLVLGSAQLVDLPLLPEGVAPYPADPDFAPVADGALGIEAKGSAAVRPLGPGVDVAGEGAAAVRGQGVRLELEGGDRARFAPLGPPPAQLQAPPEPAPPPPGGGSKLH